MRISVLLAVYNGASHLSESIQSILDQTFRDFEFVIVNDGSTDETKQILETFKKQDSRIKLIQNDTNIGLTRSLNSGFKHVHGEYIARMDADDIALPKRFEMQLQYLESHPEVGVVGTAYEWINDSGQGIGKPNILTKPKDIQRILIRTNPLMHGSVMMRTEVFKCVGGYDESYTKAQDYALWFKCIKFTQLANLPEVLMQKRMSKHMISFASEQMQMRFGARARLRAIQSGLYPSWTLFYVLKPLIASLLPARFVRFVRIHIFNQRIYSHPSLC